MISEPLCCPLNVKYYEQAESIVETYFGDPANYR